MSFTSKAKKVRSTRGRVALVAALSVGAAVLPVALAGPAQAAPTQYTQNACTVTAGRPVSVVRFVNFRLVRQINYPVSVYCKYGRAVNLLQTFHEDDGATDQNIGRVSPPLVWVAPGRTVSFNRYQPIVNTELGAEEVYQKVYFQEGLQGLWTPWQGPRTSLITSIPDV